MGSLNVCSGESSTQTLFLRVMDTFDDDDDDDEQQQQQQAKVLCQTATITAVLQYRLHLQNY